MGWPTVDRLEGLGCMLVREMSHSEHQTLGPSLPTTILLTAPLLGAVTTRSYSGKEPIERDSTKLGSPLSVDRLATLLEILDQGLVTSAGL